MRVSDQAKHKAVQKNMNANAEELQNLMVGLSNGKKLNKPSDDPVGAAKVQDFHTSIDRSKNLEKNLGSDKVWLNATESAVNQVSETMLRIKESTLKGATDGVTKEERVALSNEISMITSDLVKLANKREGKLFLFSGTKTFSEPLTLNDQLQQAKIQFDGLRVKSTLALPPIDQGKPLSQALPMVKNPDLPDLPPLPAIRPGVLEIFVEPKIVLDADGNPVPVETESVPVELDEEGNPIPPAEDIQPKDPQPVRIEITGQESITDLIKQINDKFIEASGYKEDAGSIAGFESKLHAQIGTDNKIYLDPAAEHTLRFGEDHTGLLKSLGFRFLGQAENSAPLGTEGAEVQTEGDVAIPFEEYQPLFKGYSKQTYLVRVVKPGTYGDARYIVSDDKGKTWSENQVLNKQNEIYNPEGKPSDQVRMQFAAPGQPYFLEGLEFSFDGNEFVEYHGNDEIKKVPIDNGIKVALNTTAADLFWEKEGDPETVNTFEVLNRLIEALDEDDQETIAKSIQEIDTGINQVLKIRAEVGSRVLELESSQDRLVQNIDSKSAEMSEIQDMDLAKGAIDLNKAELKHQSSLDASSRLIQPTLVQFLK